MTQATLFPDVQVPRSSKEQFRRVLQASILRHAISYGEVHADDILSWLKIPEGVHPNVVGLAFSCLVDACLIERVDYRRSSRAVRHRGLSRVWRICDMKGALGYLKGLEGQR